MILYRYLPTQYALEALQKRKWKIGRTLELNDPADFSPSFAPIASEGNSSPTRKDPMHMGSRVLDSINQMWGIICFSEVCDDPVLWSHYGDQHRGIALGFEFDTSTPYPPFQISYTNDVAVMDLWTFGKAQSQGGTVLYEEAAKCFGKKAKSWSYEKEWRRMIPLDACECSMQGENFFYDMPIVFLRRVMLGVRCQVHPLDIHRCIRDIEEPQSIEISTMSLNDKSYILDSKPYHLRTKTVETPADVGLLYHWKY